jgi:SAM-dependent methyltransferase
MGYVFDFKDATTYDAWLNSERNRLVLELEHRLMLEMLMPSKGESLLDIGCGTGASVEPFLAHGVTITGLDPSPYMLDIALAKFGHRVDVYRGYAEDLPFEDNSFNHAVLFTTLEFVEDPTQAIAEACRVAKDRLFLGVLNRYAIKGFERRVKGIFTDTIFNRAKFFGIWELKNVLRKIVGDVPVRWRTVCQFPIVSEKYTHVIEKSSLVQRCPFGAFVGIVVTLVPQFRTRPLTARYQAKHPTGAVTA